MYTELSGAMPVATTAQCPTRPAQITGEWTSGYLVKNAKTFCDSAPFHYNITSNALKQIHPLWPTWSQAETSLYLISGSFDQSWSIQCDGKHRD